MQWLQVSKYPQFLTHNYSHYHKKAPDLGLTKISELITLNNANENLQSAYEGLKFTHVMNLLKAILGRFFFRL